MFCADTGCPVYACLWPPPICSALGLRAPVVATSLRSSIGVVSRLQPYEPRVTYPGSTVDGSMSACHAAHPASPSVIPPVALHRSPSVPVRSAPETNVMIVSSCVFPIKKLALEASQSFFPAPRHPIKKNCPHNLSELGVKTFGRPKKMEAVFLRKHAQS